MKKNFVSNSSDSIRMFKNGFLESLSKVHFFVPLIVFIPVIVFLIWKSLFDLNMAILPFAGYALFGIFVWTLTEYVMHRYVFHFYPTSDWGKKIHFIFHGVHHDYPNDAKRLVMPPSASIPLALGFFFLFQYLLPIGTVYAFFLGFISGYLAYDMTHYALHHANFKNGFWKKLKQHHMLHHYSDSTRGYGVSSDIWDKILGSNFLKK
ncbi:sterol desaturase family protein [Pedobacter duraquae]|uniref:Fatty acid hydroxylase family protein n=1 Tax=Pedobacter duraquae TaxID=425511 RepID=A0A4R6IKC9_9SPHI|nr:sterol desaturase family protein [Pedobacter duraquae]TDO22405.1 fatty acid hydroxylase family protein [Pedobacter duraquae]